jgi:integrase
MSLFLRWLWADGRFLDIRDLDYLLAAAYQRHLLSTPYTRHFGGAASGRSLATVRDYLRTLKTYSSYLFKVERAADGKPLLPRNPLAGYPLPEGEDPEKETLKNTEIERLLTSFNRKTATGLRNFAICILFLETAMRCGELLRLALLWRAVSLGEFV